jgi:hypothetical protein
MTNTGKVGKARFIPNIIHQDPLFLEKVIPVYKLSVPFGPKNVL